MPVNTLHDHCTVSARRKYTDADRLTALDIVAVVGTAEAAKQTGINQNTIASWARRADVTGPSVDQRAQASRVAWETRRQHLADKLGEVADEATLRIRQLIADPDAKLADVTRALDVLLTKASLLGGEATERVDYVNRTAAEPAERQATATTALDELAARRVS